MDNFVATGLVVLAAFTAAVLMVGIIISAIAKTARIVRRSQSGEDDIRQRVERRYRQRALFAFHVVLFIFLNVVIWFYTPPGYRGNPANLLVPILWAAFLCIHGLGLYFNEAKERAIQREFERHWSANSTDKRKRDRLVLGEDGELDPVEDEWDEPEKAVQR